MKVLAKFLVTGLSLTCLVGPAVAAQQLSASREQTLRAEVKAALDQYYAWFSAGRWDLVAQRAYQAPALFLGLKGLDVRLSEEAVTARFEALLKPLIADGYARSEIPSPRICVLSETAATVSGRYIRYRKDGSIMGEFGATYIFARTRDGWRMVALINHDADKGLGCTS
jgi:SnoaL-like domain